MSSTSLKEIALLFLKLGATAFGGPAAHVAMMEEEVVRKRQWLTQQEFLDLLGATNLMPGPNSTELAIHIGHSRGGWQGLLVAGTCFILPAFFIVATLAWVYVTYGSLPEFNGILYGVKPVVIAVVLQALWNVGKTALKSRLLVFLAVVSAAISLAGVNELAVIFVGGALMALKQGLSQMRGKSMMLLPTALLAQVAPVTAASMTTFGLWPLFLFFLKVGAVLFGSGYVLLAFLRTDLVEHWGWLTETQLLDAVAIGQVTPGPVFTTATFIGYILGQWPGAILATLGIFLPSFFFVAVSGPLIPKLRQSPIAGAILDGVNAAAWALMLVVTYQLAGSAFIDYWTSILGIISASLLLLIPINSAWLVLAGGGIGYLISSL